MDFERGKTTLKAKRDLRCGPLSLAAGKIADPAVLAHVSDENIAMLVGGMGAAEVVKIDDFEKAAAKAAAKATEAKDGEAAGKETGGA